MRRNVENFFFLFVPVLLLLIWYLMPIVSVVPILLYLAFIKPPKIIEISLLLLVASVFGLINYTKEPQSDLLTYYSWLHDFLNYSIFNFSEVRPLDPAFYFPTAIISHLTNASGPIFILFWTTVTYFVAFVALIKLAKLVKLKRHLVFAIIGYVAFIGYSFGLSGHLVRQYAAMSFLLLSFVVALSGDKRSYLLFLISVFLHHSAIVFLPVIYFSNLKFISFNKTVIYVLFLLIFSLILGASNLFIYLAQINSFGLNFLTEIAARSELYVDKNDGNIIVRLLLEFLIYTLIFLYLTFINKSQVKLKFLFFVLFFWSIIIVTRSTDLLLLRYYFYGYGVMSLAMVFIARSHHFILYLLVMFLSFTALPRFLRSIESSNWYFISNDFEIIFYSVKHMLFY